MQTERRVKGKNSNTSFPLVLHQPKWNAERAPRCSTQGCIILYKWVNSVLTFTMPVLLLPTRCQHGRGNAFVTAHSFSLYYFTTWSNNWKKFILKACYLLALCQVAQNHYELKYFSNTVVSWVTSLVFYKPIHPPQYPRYAYLMTLKRNVNTT